MSNVTDFDDLYGSKYFSASDLHGETPRRRIGKVDQVELKGKDGRSKREVPHLFRRRRKAVVAEQNQRDEAGGSLRQGPLRLGWRCRRTLRRDDGARQEGVRVRLLKPTAASDLNDTINF